MSGTQDGVIANNSRRLIDENRTLKADLETNSFLLSDFLWNGQKAKSE